MKILAIMATMKFANELIKDICRQYPDKVLAVYRSKGEVILKNGDTIKAVSESSHLDGIEADVAIGPHAEDFTHTSRQGKRVWTYNGLTEYLSVGLASRKNQDL